MGISIQNVNKVYYPEPDLLNVTYSSAVFSKIPKKLFRKKKNSKIASRFSFCQNITKIPEDLFKNNPLATDFNGTFEASEIKTIPENLFKYNNNVRDARRLFYQCSNIINIPEKIIDFANKVKERTGDSIYIYMVYLQIAHQHQTILVYQVI